MTISCLSQNLNNDSGKAQCQSGGRSYNQVERVEGYRALVKAWGVASFTEWQAMDACE